MEKKELLRLELKLPALTSEEGSKLQYNLASNLAVYRVFDNGFTRRATVILDESKMSKGELIDSLADYSPEIVKEEKVTLDEIIEASMSWRNRIKSK